MEFLIKQKLKAFYINLHDLTSSIKKLNQTINILILSQDCLEQI